MALVKNPTAVQEPQEAQVQFLGQEDPQRRVWHSTSVFLPGECHGQRSLGAYSPWVIESWAAAEHAQGQPC